MDSDAPRFAVFVLVSLIAFIAILQFVTRHRAERPRRFIAGADAIGTAVLF